MQLSSSLASFLGFGDFPQQIKESPFASCSRLEKALPKRQLRDVLMKEKPTLEMMSDIGFKTSQVVYRNRLEAVVVTYK